MDDVFLAIMSLGHLQESDEPSQAKVKAGIAGNFLFRYLTRAGRLANTLETLNKTALGPPLEWFRAGCSSGRLNVVIATGEVKLPILLATIRGGLCNVLLTDTDLASRLCQELSKGNTRTAPVPTPVGAAF